MKVLPLIMVGLVNIGLIGLAALLVYLGVREFADHRVLAWVLIAAGIGMPLFGFMSYSAKRVDTE